MGRTIVFIHGAGVTRSRWDPVIAHSAATTDFRELPGRTRRIIAQPCWEEVASSSGDWLAAG